MKKIFLCTLLTIAVSSFLSQSATSAVFDNGATGGVVTITTAGVATATGSLTFDPSTKVRISGGSSATSFAMAAYHTGVVGKKAAQAYGMAADSNKQFVLDISDTGDSAAVGAILVAADTNTATAFPATGGTVANWVSI